MIEERCSCGATVTVKRWDAETEHMEIEDWRKNHRHEMPKPVTIAPFGTRQPQRPYDVRWGGGEVSNTNTEAAQRSIGGES